MIWAAIRTRVGRAMALLVGFVAMLRIAQWRGRSDALAGKRADDMQDAYNAEVTRNEIDRATDGPDARDRLRADWKRK